MKLLVIRHAWAEDRESFALTGKDDGQRPLTDRGRRRMRQAAQGLLTLVPSLDELATSPLVRAAQTAEVVAKVYAGPEPVEVEALEPGRSPRELGQWLAGQDATATLAAVGHEPSLSEAITWFLSGLSTPFLSLKKGGACLLEFPDKVDGSNALLHWVLAPAQLRRLR